MSNQEQDPLKRKYQSRLSGRDLRASSIGWEIALPIVGGTVIGYLIDQRYQTGVTFTLGLLFFGLVISIMSLIRFIVYEFSLIREKEEEDKQKDDQIEHRKY